MDLSTPLGIDCPIHSGRYRSIPRGVTASFCHLRYTFDVLLQTDLLITSFAVVSQPTVHFVSHPFPAPRSDPTHSAFVARHLVGVRQTAVLREPFTIFRTRVRSTLRTSDLQLSSISIDVLDPSSMSISIDVHDRSGRAADSSLPGDVERKLRTPTHDAAPCSSHTFVHFLFELNVSFPCRRDFQLPLPSRWSALVAQPPLAPTRLGCGDVSLVPLRLEAIAFDAVASTRTRGFTTFAMSAAMATAPRALDALLVNA